MFTINHISKYKRGTNQFVKKHRGFQFKGYKEVAVICLILMPVIYFGHQVAASKEGKYLSPIPDDAYANTIQTSPTPPIVNKPVYEQIESVFGSDTPKAMKLLSCENHALNPDAVNTAGNYPKGSRDIGVFQINEYWQKVNAKFLFDPQINIEIAHKIYTDSGNNFKLWTCGRKFNI